MYSSGKFFVPIKIVGPALAAGRAEPANRPRTIATPREIANAALAALRVCLRITGAPFGTGGGQQRGHYVSEVPSESSLSVTPVAPATLPPTAPSRSSRLRARL